MAMCTLNEPVNTKKARAKHSFSRKFIRNRVIAVTLLAITVVVSVWQYSVAARTSQILLPQSYALADVGQSLTEFHLWFEEYLQGDTYYELEHIMSIPAATLDRLNTISNGGRARGIMVQPVEDPLLNSALEGLGSRIEYLVSSAEERLRLGDAGVSGTEIDQRFDQQFREVLSAYEIILRIMDEKIESNVEYISDTGVIIIVLSVVIKGLIIVFIVSSHRSFQTLVTQLSREMVEKEEALIQARRSGEAKSAFLATISHELRTPLNAIMGFAEIMKLELFGIMQPKYREYSRAIYYSAERFLSVVNTLIDISRIESNRIDHKTASVEIAESLRDVVEMLTPRAVKRRVSLVPETKSHADSINTDKKLLYDILINIVDNAIKFTPSGGSVRLSWFGNEKGVSIVVEDTGIGMTQGEIEMAILAFSQVNPHLARPGDGSGLGLPLAKMATENLGGAFSIKSSKGIGTRIEIWLPREQRAAGNV